MNAYTLIVTVVVLVAVAVFILLFERKRARGIERDLSETARQRRDADDAGRGPEDGE